MGGLSGYPLLMPDRGDEWYLLQEKTVDGLWATYAGPYYSLKEAREMKTRALARHHLQDEDDFRVVRCMAMPG